MSIHKHLTKKWEVSLIEFLSDDGPVFKVTRRLPDLHVAETIVFTDKESAKKLLDEWLK